MIGEFDEIFAFVHGVFGTSGSCFEYCEICEKSYPACGGENFNKKGDCPDDCFGSRGNFLSIAWDWKDRQVGECCFEKVFRPLKELLDDRRDSILEYYAECIKKEKEGLAMTEALLNEASKNR